GPNYQRPKMPLPANFSEATTRPTTQPAIYDVTANEAQLRRWWTIFNDPELNSLIARAIKGNLSLQTSEEQIREARALRDEAFANLLPMVNVDGSYNHSRTSGNLGYSNLSSGNSTSSGGTTIVPTNNQHLENNLYQAGFDSTWEIDIFGGTRRAVEAANAQIDVAIDNRQDVLVTLLGEVATDYVTIRGLQLQIQIAQDNVSAQEQTLTLTKTKSRAGLVSDLSVVQQEALLMSTEATVPDLQEALHQTIHALSVLLGEEPGALYAELSKPEPIPVGPGEVPPGLPSQLLLRRPDIRAAERSLAAANAEVGVAVADLFPKFSLTGDFGVESSHSQNLFDYQSRFFDIGPNMSWPIFSGGQIQANIDVQNSLDRQALIAYRQTVLTALQQVDDALIAVAKEQDRRQELEDAVKANQRAVDLTLELYKNGLEDFLDVLTAQASLFSAQEALAVSDETVSMNLVALYKALGGGWDVPAK
ncbi:MAG TPA: efflux transporter outer membrane subunit, partial [Tepidisphaeraceae bacterium]|nr:efflux transporter outer membrane subunit [Tepidisphaeraceae bacterium]